VSFTISWKLSTPEILHPFFTFCVFEYSTSCDCSELIWLLVRDELVIGATFNCYLFVGKISGHLNTELKRFINTGIC